MAKGVGTRDTEQQNDQEQYKDTDQLTFVCTNPRTMLLDDISLLLPICFSKYPDNSFQF